MLIELWPSLCARMRTRELLVTPCLPTIAAAVNCGGANHCESIFCKKKRITSFLTSVLMASTAGATWSKEEILKLFEIWGQETTQKQLQECKRNQSIFEDVTKQMREAGYEQIFQQCREKIKKLKGEYEKKRISITELVREE